MTDLSFVGALGFAAAGVVASVMIPVLRASIPHPPGDDVGVFSERFMGALRPYLALGLFSLLVAVMVLAVAEAADTPLRTWYEALLAGYVSESTLEKLIPPQ